MSRTKELGEAWFGCQAELKHVKAILKLKETHILTLKEYIQSLKRKEMRRQQREKKRAAEKKAADLNKVVWIGAGEMEALCAKRNDLLEKRNKILLTICGSVV